MSDNQVLHWLSAALSICDHKLTVNNNLIRKKHSLSYLCVTLLYKSERKLNILICFRKIKFLLFLSLLVLSTFKFLTWEKKSLNLLLRNHFPKNRDPKILSINNCTIIWHLFIFNFTLHSTVSNPIVSILKYFYVTGNTQTHLHVNWAWRWRKH